MTSPSPGEPDRLAESPANLFAYGTLLFPEVLRVLLGRVPDSTSAILAGWRVAPLPGQIAPCLVPAEALAKGRLVAGLTPQEWRTLDAFEHSESELRPLTLTDGRDAWAYVCCDPVGALPDDWDAETFERDHFIDYLRRCAAWKRGYNSQASDR